MTTISERLQATRDRVRKAAEAAGRDPQEVLLLAVSKAHSSDELQEAFDAGQRAFGESYLQEALAKQELLKSLPIEWHFIGPIQSNKTRPIAEHFSWVHGVDRLKIAQRLSEARPETLPPLNVCLQVNVSGEASKSGCAPNEVAALAEAVSALPRLKLRGLMTIPEPSDDIALQHRRFRMLKELRDGLAAQGYALDTLSMGMSDDFATAIAEGSTIVRVGTAIFGPRQYRTETEA
ncbi:PLP dependent protein [Novimethylophilus kurashikiensis]|uniref:Pyridoxal phosphate homeostasis protein n=1 Tax=Novimethylophilus kurashikiensis TaxID=1825523 RepID=A0A2R5FHV5_9PROT|nr:YggS family pyridoxal phosphate-dependent enzyme [Novimethylophilus kurashikiensis]GBG15631.1 PLP dependent protein [Novimethylophilus kurashikiensis]